MLLQINVQSVQSVLYHHFDYLKNDRDNFSHMLRFIYIVSTIIDIFRIKKLSFRHL